MSHREMSNDSMTNKLEINKTLLVVAALHALGGESDLEHIAVKAHELFPGQFCWRSFPQYPDKDAVRVHLSEAKKRSSGELVTDHDLRHERRGSRGYTKRFALTRAGIEKAAALQEQIGAAEARGASVGAQRNSLEHKRMVAPIQASEAFEQFVNGRAIAGIGRDSFLEAFKLFPDASRFVIVGRLSRAATAVAVLEQSERAPLERFIKEGRDAFGF
jgi:hypothetical protein